MAEKHILTPWHYAARGDSQRVRSGIEDKVSAEDFPFVIWMPSPPFALGATCALVARSGCFESADNDAEGRAELIVRAVNSHVALIEAVEGGLAHALPHDDCDWVKQARAALRLAKGE